MPRPKLLPAEFPIKEQLLRQFEWRDRQPVLFMQTDQRLELGERVKLVVRTCRNFKLVGIKSPFSGYAHDL
jgi:hypothetical protein